VRLWEDRDSRSVLVGIAGVLLVHLLLFFLAPHMLHSDSTPNVMRPNSSSQQFNIEMAPDEFVKPPEKAPPFNFVEANPNAPDNVPDKTNNFAAQNQQVAQEKPTPDSKSDRPAMEGRTDIQSNQIVSGQLVQAVESAPTPPAEDQPEKKEATPRLEQTPLTGFEKTEGQAENSFGSNIAKFAEGAKAVPERVEGMKDVPLIQNADSSQPRIDPHKPRPRPQVVKQQQVRPAIFQENKLGTQNIGTIAYDAKWSNYGQYLQKMIEAVQVQFDRLNIESRIAQVSGTNVKVVFKLNNKGEIAQVVTVDGNGGPQAQNIAVSSITARAPYGPWTDDMVAVLGEVQELTFVFYYQ
jgi:hypothetical protein